MIDLSKTRVILDGRVLENVSSFRINFGLSIPKSKPTVFIYVNLETGLETILAYLLDIDIVRENHLDKNKDTITWTQVVCEEIV